MLYDRILKILDIFFLAKSQCAKELGVTHKTFAGYLKPEGEHHLWRYLPKFLEWFPRLSRQWLYFGEGPMLIGHGVPLDKPVPLRMIAEAVDAMAKDAGGIEAEVYRYICGIPIPERDASGAASEEGLSALKEKLLRADEKIIALQDELLALHRGQTETLVFSSGAGPSLAPDGPTAARSSHRDNE